MYSITNLIRNFIQIYAVIVGKCTLEIVFWMSGLRNDTIKIVNQKLTEVLLEVFRNSCSPHATFATVARAILVEWSLVDTPTNLAKANALITTKKQAIDLIESELLKSQMAKIKFMDLLYKATSKCAELKKHNVKFISIENYGVVESSGERSSKYM